MRSLAIFSPSNISQLVILILKQIIVLAISLFTSAVTSPDSINMIDNRVILTLMDLVALKLQLRTSRPCTKCRAASLTKITQIIKKLISTRLIVSEIIKSHRDPKIPRFSVSVPRLTLLNPKMLLQRSIQLKRCKKQVRWPRFQINLCVNTKKGRWLKLRSIWTFKSIWMRYSSRSKEHGRTRSEGSSMPRTIPIMITRQVTLFISQPSLWWKMQASLTLPLKMSRIDLEHKIYIKTSVCD